jgi:hypothetical protein
VSRVREKRRRRRLVLWLLVTLSIVAELVGVGLLHATGASGLRAPVISSVGLPTDPTPERTAAFMFTYDRTTDFRCTFDGAREDCGSGVFGQATYEGLALGRHTFGVRAIVGEQVSPAASYSWTIVATPADGGGSGPGGAVSGSGQSSTAGDSAPFEISGDVTGLVPGVSQPIVLTLRNPNAAAIIVTSVAVEVGEDSTPPGCPSELNIALDQPSGISPASPVRVPGHGSVVLSTYPLAPRIGFVDRPWNQDGCKGKSFALSYSGSAHS